MASTTLALVILAAAPHDCIADRIFAIGPDADATKPKACGPGTVGLLEGDVAEWVDGMVDGSCIAVGWTGDALTATTLESGTVVVYVDPGSATDTYFAHVDFKTKNVTKVVIGGEQGELRCLASVQGLRCYGVVPGDKTSPTQLIGVDGTTGDSKPVLNLTNYIGYSIGASVVDPTDHLYHAVLVGKVHAYARSAASYSGGRLARRRCKSSDCPFPGVSGSSRDPPRSDQWLVTIDLAKMAIVAEAPLSSTFMGPLSVSAAHGLATFGADEYAGLVAVDYHTGSLRRLTTSGDFGTIFQLSGAFSRTHTYV